MQILLACAKLMSENITDGKTYTLRQPEFISEADKIASAMCHYSVNELADMLHVSHDIAVKAYHYYTYFPNRSTQIPTIMQYDGIVFKNINAATLSESQLKYADEHINICSFVYGLLRPLDTINPYRMEGNVELPALGNDNLFDYWRPRLTDVLIRRVKDDDGILVNLASNEMRKLFDWKRVVAETTVITPEFKVETLGKPRTITVYAKICRGAMSRFIIEHKPENPEDLQSFASLGFMYEGGSPSSPVFVWRP